MPQQIQQQDRLIQAKLTAEFTTTLQGSLLLRVNLAT